MLRKAAARIQEFLSTPQKMAQERILESQGRILTRLNESLGSDLLSDYEFGIFSQFGEDGIIQHLLGRIQTYTPFFVEFGVETFSEANCRFLMLKDRWAGVVFDGSETNVGRIKASSWYWRSNLDARRAFLTAENVADLFRAANVPKDLGILSIDVDGIDYFLLDRLGEYRPAVLICEFNALFGPSARVSVPYDPAFVRHRAHHSGVYFGASLAAFEYLAAARGYALVGVTSEKLNAFFVREELLWPGAKRLTASQAWGPMTFRQARDEQGRLTFASFEEERAAIAHLPLVDVTTGQSMLVGDLGR